MEIPAALHALEKQYNDLCSKFNFGKYDPREQAEAFQKIVADCFEKEEDQSLTKHVCFLNFDNSHRNENFLQTLWETLSPFTELNFS